MRDEEIKNNYFTSILYVAYLQFLKLLKIFQEQIAVSVFDSLQFSLNAFYDISFPIPLDPETTHLHNIYGPDDIFQFFVVESAERLWKNIMGRQVNKIFNAIQIYVLDVLSFKTNISYPYL